MLSADYRLQTIDIRRQTVGEGMSEKVWCLPARSPASRSLAEGRRFGEGRSKVWCLQFECGVRREECNEKRNYVLLFNLHSITWWRFPDYE